MANDALPLESEKSLQSLNTLAVPALASHYAIASDVDELKNVVRWAKGNGHAIHILGGGSNVIPAAYIKGVVIQPKLKGIKVTATAESDEVFITIGAGENWHEMVEYCVNQGYFGIENLALIPGDAGAAPIQNIGAYGVELKDVLHSLKALNLETLTVEHFAHADCGFAYRDSVFKSRQPGQYVITEITLKLSSAARVNLSYPALRDYVVKHFKMGELEPTPKDVMSAVIEIRRSKLPDPVSIPNAGSFFKNPVITLSKFKQLQARFPAIPGYDVGAEGKKLAAAWLIDQAGWKGREYAGIVVHAKHALVLTNPNKKDAGAILLAVEQIQQDIKAMFEIVLELEPRLLGS